MTTSRRNFLRKTVTGSLAAIAIPSFAGTPTQRLSSPPAEIDEAYWRQVKGQFAIRPDLVMMNAANLCPSPAAVNEKLLTFQKGLSADVSMQYRAQFAEQRKKSLELLSAFIHADAGEVGITRNTSESNCTIVNGLDLKAGDEVILWDQNHPSNKEIWLKRAERTGIVIKMVTLPETVSGPLDVITEFTKAFTTKTRLIAFSHISNVTGTALPAMELCALAKTRKAWSLVDGAQTLGFHDVDVKKIGCDFYTASTHKWLMGPIENGVLFMKREHIARIWPAVVGGGWHDGTTTVDDKICFLGQRNDPTTAALPEIIAFHETIGKANIWKRVVELNTFLKEQIKASLPTAKFITPLSQDLSGGIVILNVPGSEAKVIVQKLYAEHGIAAATTGGVRLSPHIYNSKEDIARVTDALIKCCA
jgi:isopenicillin-N epimerase